MKQNRDLKQSPVQSVRCNLGGAKTPLVIGVDRAISGDQDDRDVIGIGLRSRAYTSKCGHALAAGMAALAEISGDAFFACSVGLGTKSVSYCETGSAIAVGYGPEAAALGRCGVAVAIADGSDDPPIVSAGPGGRLIVVWLSCGRVFEKEVDGSEFRAGIRYTVSPDGIWSDVPDEEKFGCDLIGFEYPVSQVIAEDAKGTWPGLSAWDAGAI
jgi:hypothetical protein